MGWRALRRAGVLVPALVFATAFGPEAPAQPVAADTSRHGAAASDAPSQETPVALVFEGIRITTFRTRVAGLTPAERAETALRRLESLRPPFAPEDIRVEPIPGGRALFAGEVLAFAVTQGDLDIRLLQAVEQEASAARAKLTEALKRRASRWTTGYLARAAIFSLLATLAAVVFLALLVRGSQALLSRLAADAEWKRRHLVLRGFDVSSPVSEALSWATRIGGVTAAMVAAYTWMTFVLNRFPQTQPWGRAARSFLAGMAGGFASGILSALPGLLTAAAILLLARGATRLVTDFFAGIERGTVSLPGVHPETVGATRRLVNALIWVFAVVFSYPFLPGSDSDVFKGVSVFVGLLFTLGSTGVVGHMMSGLVLVYSRALRKGDYVRVGDVEGYVIEVGALSTKIANLRDEEFTIPNAVMVGTTIKNHSRLAGRSGATLTTQVTIRYDAPWRVVHEMLTTAAARTTGLRTDPAPYVLQAELSDFYVLYRLVARLEVQERRWLVLSQLHQNIQDAFNEGGVQIMSPHFEAQPERPVVVPRSKWHAAGDPGESGPD